MDPPENQGELGEDDDEHEVPTEDEEVVDAPVGDGEHGGDDAVDTDAHPEGVDDLLLAGLGSDHLLVEVPGQLGRIGGNL